MNTAAEDPIKNHSTQQVPVGGADSPEPVAATDQSQTFRDSTQEPGQDLAENPVKQRSRLMRFGLIVLGILFVILAVVGVFLPGLPATGPLILASLCLAKSSPELERRLVRSRFFAPFHQYLDGKATMPLRAKVIAMLMMWTCIIVSSIMIFRTEGAGHWIIAVMVIAGLVGTFVIARFGRNRGSE